MVGTTLLNIGLVAFGLVGLFIGGQWLVKGASRLASSFGISPLLIGLTVVSLGTSMPELIVSVTAALNGVDGVSLGNILGSNIANIGLILGVTGLIGPIGISSSLIKREIPFMIAVGVIVYALAFDNKLVQLEGLFLVIMMVFFTVAIYFLGQKDKVLQPELLEFEEAEGLIDTDPSKRMRELGMIAVGIAFLLAGAQFMVYGASELAHAAGVSDLVIGFTIVAFGTSLPELTTSSIAALRGEGDIAIGNVIGSNITNLLLIMGTTVMIKPLNIDRSVLRFEFPVMILFSLLLIPFARNQQLDRRESMLFLTGYVGFSLFLVI